MSDNDKPAATIYRHSSAGSDFLDRVEVERPVDQLSDLFTEELAKRGVNVIVQNDPRRIAESVDAHYGQRATAAFSALRQEIDAEIAVLAELQSLRLESHRLRELVKAADLVHIRLRAGLMEALERIDWYSEQLHEGTGRCPHPDPRVAEWRKLVSP